MEIRNGLTVLTKIASVFPVMKKSGVNLERRVCLLLLHLVLSWNIWLEI